MAGSHQPAGHGERRQLDVEVAVAVRPPGHGARCDGDGQSAARVVACSRETVNRAGRTRWPLVREPKINLKRSLTHAQRLGIMWRWCVNRCSVHTGRRRPTGHAQQRCSAALRASASPAIDFIRRETCSRSKTGSESPIATQRSTDRVYTQLTMRLLCDWGLLLVAMAPGVAAYTVPALRPTATVITAAMVTLGIVRIVRRRRTHCAVPPPVPDSN